MTKKNSYFMPSRDFKQEESPFLDNEVKAIIERIRKLEDQMGELEGKDK